MRNRYVRSALNSLTESNLPDAAPPPLPSTEIPADTTFGDALSRLLAKADRARSETKKTGSQEEEQEGEEQEDSKDTVLFFDQFEGILTSDPTDTAAKEQFFAEVGEVLRNPPLWALFAIREDFLAGLDPYIRHIPGRFSTRFRLELLGVDAAREAIVNPAENAISRVTFTKEATDELIEDLCRVWGSDPTGQLVKKLGPSIEPMLLQVACLRLWESLPADTREISKDDVLKRVAVESALGQYYDQEVKEAARETAAEGQAFHRERALRDWTDLRLITQGRLRGQAPESELESEGLSRGGRREAGRRHLIRREENVRGSTWYELSHDRLVDPILQSNRDWRKQLHPFRRRGSLGRCVRPDPGVAAAGHRVGRGRASGRREPGATFAQGSGVPGGQQGLPRAAVRWVWHQPGRLRLGRHFRPRALILLSAFAGALLEHRQRQATQERVDFYRVFDGPDAYAPGETARQFLARQGAGAGLADWNKVPYYLLIVGAPEAIPFEFQYELSVRYAVGRLDFEDPESYRRYALSVVEAESGKFSLPRQAAVFAPAHPNDPATRLSPRMLAKPLLVRLGRTVLNWTVQGVVKDEARKDRLARLLGGDETPAVLFVAGRAPEFKPGDPLQATDQGAILCQDWPGFRRAEPQHYFSAADISDNARLLGLIAFLFLPSGAGVSASRDYSFLGDVSPRPIGRSSLVCLNGSWGILGARRSP